jgi:hypothetical protein
MHRETVKFDRIFVEVELNIIWKYDIDIYFEALSSEVTGIENKIHTSQTITVNANVLRGSLKISNKILTVSHVKILSSR